MTHLLVLVERDAENDLASEVGRQRLDQVRYVRLVAEEDHMRELGRRVDPRVDRVLRHRLHELAAQQRQRVRRQRLCAASQREGFTVDTTPRK